MVVYRHKSTHSAQAFPKSKQRSPQTEDLPLLALQAGGWLLRPNPGDIMSGYTMVGLIAFVACMITMVMFGAFLGRVLEIWVG